MTDPLPPDPGAPIATDAIDPELIRLSRSRPNVGLITAAGIVFLCGYFLVRLSSDRQFAGRDPTPERATVADVMGNRIAVDRFIALEGAQPMMAGAMRATASPGSLGFRVVPVAGTGERVWLAMPGNGWSRPALGPYEGRLRRLADLPFAPSITTYATEHPRVTFATVSAVRAGFSTGTVRDVAGDAIALADSDRVAMDVVDASTAEIVGVLGERLPSPAAWAGALASAGIAATAPPQTGDDAVRFTVKVDSTRAEVEAKLEAAKLWAARVDPVTHHFDTTWGALKSSPPGALHVDRPSQQGSAEPPEKARQVIADDQIDLIGLYTAHSIPRDAYLVIVGERPEDYWYIQPITIGLALMGIVFVFALIVAVRRDLLPARA